MFDNQSRETSITRPRPACPGGAMFDESVALNSRCIRLVLCVQTSLRPDKPGGDGVIKISRFWLSNIAPPGQAGRGRECYPNWCHY